MKKDATMQIRIDERTKIELMYILNEMNLDISVIFNVFLKQIIINSFTPIKIDKIKRKKNDRVKNTTIQVRVNKEERNLATKILSSNDIDMSTAMNALIAQIIEYRKIPFEIKL